MTAAHMTDEQLYLAVAAMLREYETQPNGDVRLNPKRAAAKIVTQVLRPELDRQCRKEAGLMKTCPATYEPVPADQTSRTHTCDQPAKHNGKHHCPLCGAAWTQDPAPAMTAEHLEDRIHLRLQLIAAEAVIRVVRDLHRDNGTGYCKEEPFVRTPCLTLRALDAANQPEDEAGQTEMACFTAYDGDKPVGPYHQTTESDVVAAVSHRGYTIERWHCPLHDGRQPTNGGEQP